LEDQKNYQTTYAKVQGSVAAPTAGLHFTSNVMKELNAKDIHNLETTLHVGAGTFKPVETENIQEHDMHAEQFELRLNVVEALLKHNGKRVAVGTTSLRVLESLYQIGVNIYEKVNDPILVKQHQDSTSHKLSYKESLEYVKEYLEKNGDCLASTSIFIYPGKKIRSIDALVTNFHQPGSTLTMLISCIIGESWKEVYQNALQSKYRFLSYGDSSLLWLHQD
jgi:S-adenosylmethionine:tRNA ribosyltransferase-isomerase